MAPSIKHRINDACFAYMQLNSALSNIRSISVGAELIECEFNNSIKKMKMEIVDAIDKLPELAKADRLPTEAALEWSYGFAEDVRKTYGSLIKSFYKILISDITEAFSDDKNLRNTIRYWVYYHFFKKIGFYEENLRWEDILYRAELVIESEIQNACNDVFYFLNTKVSNIEINSYIREVILELASYKYGLLETPDNAILLFYRKILEYDLSIRRP